MTSSRCVLFFCSGFMTPTGELAPPAVSDSDLFTFKGSDSWMNEWCNRLLYKPAEYACIHNTYSDSCSSSGWKQTFLHVIIWATFGWKLDSSLQTTSFTKPRVTSFTVNINILMRALTNLSAENKRTELLMSVYFGGFKDNRSFISGRLISDTDRRLIVSIVASFISRPAARGHLHSHRKSSYGAC